MGEFAMRLVAAVLLVFTAPAPAAAPPVLLRPPRASAGPTAAPHAGRVVLVSAAKTAAAAAAATVGGRGGGGGGYGEGGMKSAVDKGLIPGPGLLVTTRAIVATGSYAPRGFAPEWRLPQGAEEADGTNLRTVVREQVRAGADWIK